MNESLVVIIAILAVFQIGHRRLPAMCLALPWITHNIFFDSLESGLYYLTAIGLSVVALGVVCSKAIPSRTSDFAAIVLTLSIFSDCYGWILYEAELPHILYNDLYTVVFTLAIIALLWKGKENEHQPTSWPSLADSVCRENGGLDHALSKEA